MKRPFLCMCALATLLLSTRVSAQQTTQNDPRLAAIEKAIADKGAHWTAGPTWVSQLSPEEQRRLCGDRTELTLAAPRIPQSQSYWRHTHHPDAYDWRDVNGQNWTTPVRNQGGCGSCAAFAAIGAMEAVADIFNKNPNLNLNLSEQHLFSCGCGACCETGWHIDQACAYLTEYGTPPEGCFIYTGHNIDCRWTCRDWASRAVKISCRNWVGKSAIATPAEIKEALLERGPLAASMMVYTDFNYYTGGVYEHVSGAEEAGHGIVIVGWDDTTDPPCWICKNSWGTSWGEAGGGEWGGWFRIAMGTNHCGIEEKIIFMVMGDLPDASITEVFHNFGTVGIGDTVRWNLPVINLGKADLSIENVVFEYGEFGLIHSGFPIHVFPGDTLPLPVFFAPTTTDVQAGIGTIETNDCREPYFYLRLIGMGEEVNRVGIALDRLCGLPGEQVEFSLNLDNDQLRDIPCSRVELELTYDKVILDIVTVTATERTALFDGFTWQNRTGLIGISISDSHGELIEAGTGPIARLSFSIQDETNYGQVSEMTCPQVVVLDAAGKPVQVEIQRGYVGVYCRGDVNLDRKINVLDIIKTVIFILNPAEPPDAYQAWAADCNNDGRIDVLDAVGLSQATLDLSSCQP